MKQSQVSYVAVDVVVFANENYFYYYWQWTPRVVWVGAIFATSPIYGDFLTN